MNNLVTVWIALINRVRGPNCNYVPRAKRAGHKFERKLKTRFLNLQFRFLLFPRLRILLASLSNFSSKDILAIETNF